MPCGQEEAQAVCLGPGASLVPAGLAHFTPGAPTALPSPDGPSVSPPLRLGECDPKATAPLPARPSQLCHRQNQLSHLLHEALLGPLRIRTRAAKVRHSGSLGRNPVLHLQHPGPPQGRILPNHRWEDARVSEQAAEELWKSPPQCLQTWHCPSTPGSGRVPLRPPDLPVVPLRHLRRRLGPGTPLNVPSPC